MKNTIKKHKDFDFLGAATFTMPAFFVKYKPKKHESGEFGLIASKRNFPTAVKRNRAKRLLRTWLAKRELPKNADVLLIAREKILKTKFADGVGQITAAMKRIE
ncbi:MAG: ribonuclease P protein component [Rickettsiales bacterium]|jgi:ribonuclease P protein component|nr:ribonuclease P protein component [Rickettsiales bacterium]